MSYEREKRMTIPESTAPAEFVGSSVGQRAAICRANTNRHEKGAIPGFRPGMTPAGSDMVRLGAAPGASETVAVQHGLGHGEFTESACDAEPAHLPLVNALHVHDSGLSPEVLIREWFR
ncbi:hypothetical protein [Nocardia cyriacigeorgica]|uniref:hypothetical protein n=1 Tax=Nocardia cyriacigeorgica TaxID=135487 RepID=UPI0011B087E0|nr:hypothetical protein [Nocardia cyriacigeorgica]MBF6322493.1 hypothetical protein [Nocardia cyriacigeorgica]